MSDKTPTADDWRIAEQLWEQAEAQGVIDIDAFLREQVDLSRRAAALFRSMWDSAHSARTEAIDSAVSAWAGVAGENTEVDLIGRTLGSYRLTAKLGSGGSGAVYLGQRDGDGLFHEAAVKVLFNRLLPGSPASHAFYREQHLLSRLTHPFIAQFVDSGVDEEGLAYVVVERVRGPSVTRYVNNEDAHGASALRLMERVCQAVAFAHRHLVVHRDLKPSNILVDAETGTPKLLDFGIAKQLNSIEEEGERTSTFSCTPGYASPEQLAQSELIGTPTDTYSLGCLLYELVFGEPPLGLVRIDLGQRLQAMSHFVVPRIDASQAAKWQTAFNRGQRRDLRRVIQRCLQVDPAQRYPSVVALGEDLQRICDNLPIGIRPLTLGYRLARFSARRRGLVFAIAAASLAIVTGATAWVIQARQTAAQAQRLQSVTSVLSDMLTSPDPFKRGRDVTVVELIESALPAIEANTGSAPDVQADIDDMLGQTFLHLGRLDEAERLSQRAVRYYTEVDGPDALPTLKARLNAAAADLELGRYDEANTEFESIVSALHDSSGNAILLAKSLRFLATTRIYAHEDYDGAIAACRESLELLGDDLAHRSSEGLVTRQVMGLAISLKGDLAEAEAIQSAILSDMQRHLPAESPYQFDARNNLGRTLQKLGKMDEARDLLEANARFAESAFGNEAPDTLMAWNNLGVLDWQEGRFAEAAERFQRVVDGREKTLGADHARTLIARSNLADALSGSGDYARACPMAWETYQTLLKSEDEDSSRPGFPLKVYARCIAGRGEPEEAVRLLDQVIERWNTSRGEHHIGTLGALHDRARFLHQSGQDELARQQLQQELALREANYEPDHPETERARALLAEVENALKVE